MFNKYFWSRGTDYNREPPFSWQAYSVDKLCAKCCSFQDSEPCWVCPRVLFIPHLRYHRELLHDNYMHIYSSWSSCSLCSRKAANVYHFWLHFSLSTTLHCCPTYLSKSCCKKSQEQCPLHQHNLNLQSLLQWVVAVDTVHSVLLTLIYAAPFENISALLSTKLVVYM